MMISVIPLAIILIISSADAGVSYIRWGRKVCPAGARLLYKGHMAGATYAAGGSGANYLCLHEQPQFTRPVAETQPWTAMIYGVRLTYHDDYNLPSTPFSSENLGYANIGGRDLPCAVCYVSESTDKLMVPGRQDCGATGYDLQYKGFLVAEAHQVDRHRGEYVCVDEAPEERAGGSGNTAESVVYIVQAGCGSLPCPSYVQGYEIPCSVCTAPYCKF